MLIIVLANQLTYQGNQRSDHAAPLEYLFEEPEAPTGPPEPTLLPRARSYSDFYHVVRAQLSKDAAKKKRRKNKERGLDALLVLKPEDNIRTHKSPLLMKSIDAELVDASQQEYL
jgi:hypothetical protein